MGGPELDIAVMRAEHARAEFCCWCSPGEACRVLDLCDALEAKVAEVTHWRICHDRAIGELHTARADLAEAVLWANR